MSPNQTVERIRRLERSLFAASWGAPLTLIVRRCSSLAA